MRPWIFTIVVLIIAKTALGGSETHPTIQSALERLNAARAKYGRPALTLDTEMTSKVQKHCWSHTQPRSVCTQSGCRRFSDHSSLGYPEIVFRGPSTSQSAINGWLNSPAHRAHILGSYTTCGIGYGSDGRNRLWAVVFK
jgi:uncharacterized protein YkwD